MLFNKVSRHAILPLLAATDDTVDGIRFDTKINQISKPCAICEVRINYEFHSVVNGKITLQIEKQSDDYKILPGFRITPPSTGS